MTVAGGANREGAGYAPSSARAAFSGYETPTPVCALLLHSRGALGPEATETFLSGSGHTPMLNSSS